MAASGEAPPGCRRGGPLQPLQLLEGRCGCCGRCSCSWIRAASAAVAASAEAPREGRSGYEAPHGGGWGGPHRLQLLPLREGGLLRQIRCFGPEAPTFMLTDLLLFPSPSSLFARPGRWPLFNYATIIKCSGRMTLGIGLSSPDQFGRSFVFCSTLNQRYPSCAPPPPSSRRQRWPSSFGSSSDRATG